MLGIIMLHFGIALRLSIKEEFTHILSAFAVNLTEWIVVATIFCILSCAVDAHNKGRAMARKAGLPLNEYVGSKEYQRDAPEGLKRTDKELKW